MFFSFISEYFEKIESTSSRLEKTDYLLEIFKKCPKSDLRNLIYFCKGSLGPQYNSLEINIGQSNLIQVISEYVGQPISVIKSDLSKLGDVGLVLEKNHKNISQQTLFSKKLEFKEVYNIFKKIAETTGNGSSEFKVRLFKSILFNVDKRSAKYIIRFPISFRLGFSDSTIIDALSKLDPSLEDSKAKQLITSKYLIVSDLGLIADVIVNKGINKVNDLELIPFIPVKSQLCERSKDFDEIMNRLSSENQIFAVDTKVDGFRQQIHKQGNDIKIFTRQEKDVTSMFPDIVDSLKDLDIDFIIDCEAIGYDTKNKKYLPFQVTIQRKRKYDISQKSKDLPLHLKVFDILYLNGSKLYKKDFKYRRKIIEQYFSGLEKVAPTEIIYTNNKQEMIDFFNNRIDNNLEGIIVKDLQAPYKAGSRGFSWIKYKKSYGKTHDTLDAFVVGGFYGQGKRTVLGLGALLVALKDKATNKLYTIAKVGSGLKDEDIKYVSSLINDFKTSKKPENLVTNITPDFYITKNLVVEINYDEITKSTVHTACYNETDNQGLALRFPRFVKFRSDKSEGNSVSTLKKLYDFQSS